MIQSPIRLTLIRKNDLTHLLGIPVDAPTILVEPTGPRTLLDVPGRRRIFSLQNKQAPRHRMDENPPESGDHGSRRPNSS